MTTTSAEGLPELPELPEPGHYDDYEGEWYWTGSQMRAYGEQRYDNGQKDAHDFLRNGEQCRAASVEPVAWIRPDGVTTSDAGLMRHWEAQGLQFDPLIRALSRGVPEDTKRMDWGVVAAWFVCTNGVPVSEPFDTRQKAEGELSSRAKFYNDIYAEPCYVAGAYIAAQRKEGE